MASAAIPNPNGDVIVPSTPNDSISSLSWSPISNGFVAGCWNSQIYYWDILNGQQVIPKSSIKLDAPILCTTFHHDGDKVLTGGCDKSVKLWNLTTGQVQQVGAHDAPVKESCWIKDLGVLATGSWDKSVRYWDLRSPSTPSGVLALPERCYAMDARGPLLVVGCAERKIVVADLRKPTTPFRQYDSKLDQQTRSVLCFLDQKSFAYGSTEARVAINHVEEKDSARDFAFKCHRIEAAGQTTKCFAVNAMALHPTLGTFATAGADGTFAFWDKENRQKLHSFPSVGNTISKCAFNRDGTIFGYVASYDWSKGYDDTERAKPHVIYLHAVKDTQIRYQQQQRR